MDADPNDEGAYDAPLESYPSSAPQTGSVNDGNPAAERQARFDKVFQRRAELSQNRSPISSKLTQTSAPMPAVPKETSLAPLASSSAGLRSDIVREAVEFLTNPRVASAPTATKRRFLTERKGLTEAEADEAFRRAQASTLCIDRFSFLTPKIDFGPISDSKPHLDPAPAASSAPQVPAPPMAGAPQYYGPPVVYQQQPPIPVGPSLKSIALIVVLGVGAASIIIQLFRKYIWAYWFPKKNPLAEKIDFLEGKLLAAHELIAAQAAETKDAMVVLRSFLESQVTDWSERSRLESLKSAQDLKNISDLKREVSSVRHLIPSVSTLSRSAKSTVMQSDVLDEIKNELASLKNAVKSIVSNVPSGSNLVRLSSTALPSSVAVAPAVEAAPEASSPVPAANVLDASATASSAPVAAPMASNPLNNSTSKRALPGWMQQSQKSLPSWQMQDKAEGKTEGSPSPSPEPTEVAAPPPSATTPTPDAQPLVAASGTE